MPFNNIQKRIILVFLFLFPCIVLCVLGSEQGEGDLKEFFGINSPNFFARKGNPDIQEFIRFWLDDCRELGITRSRIFFYLNKIEPQKGQFDWELSDLLVEEFMEKNQEILPVVYSDFSMKPIPSFPAKGTRGEYCDFISLLMKRYNKDIRIWSIHDGEPFSPNQDDYIAYLKSTHLEAGRMEPPPRIMASFPDPHDSAFWESFYRNGNKDICDILSFPYFPQVMHEDELERLLIDIQYLKTRFGDEGKKIWITKMGIPFRNPDDPLPAPEKVAEWIVKTHTTAMASGIVDCIFWNILADQMGNLAELQGYYGFLNFDLSPKPAYFAYHTMTRLLKDTTYKGALSIHPGVRAFLFQKGESKVAVCWAVKGEYSLPLASKKSLTLVNLYGSDKRMNPKQNLISLTLSSQPVFLTELTDQMDGYQSMKCSPEVLYIYPGEEGELALTLDNTGGQISSKKTVHVSAPPGVILPESSWDIKDTSEDIFRKTFRIAVSQEMKPGFYSLTIRAETSDSPLKTYYCFPTLRVIDPVRIYLRGQQENLRFKMETRIENVSLHALKGSLNWELKPRGKVQTPPQNFNLSSNDTFTTNSSLIAGNKEARLVAKIKLDNGYTRQEGIGLMSIPLRLAAPRIDGDLREWIDVPELHLNGITSSGGNFDTGAGKGEKTKGVFQFWITEKDLYVGAVIHDNTPLFNPLPDDMIEQGDGIELFLGLGGPTESNRCGDKDFHIGIAPGQKDQSCRLWNWSSASSIPGGEAASCKIQNGYILEARIPFAALGAWLPKRDLMIGFDVALNDLDQDQPKTPHTLIWNGNQDNRLDPSNWGLAIIW